jgi:hypothetical protein
VTEASVAVVIGTLNVHTQACQTSGKSGLSSRSASLTFSYSGLGSAAGWKFVDNSTALNGTSGLTATYTSTAGLELCVPTRISPLCSNPESFKTHETAWGPSFVGPHTIPTVGCTSKNCKLHFKYTGASAS